jgi:hypothetical protein
MPPSELQSWHAAPATPHATFCVPSAHTFPRQHPAQLLALHVPTSSQCPPPPGSATQWPPFIDGTHTWHTPPTGPQKRSWDPTAHTFEPPPIGTKQQPLQFPG